MVQPQISGKHILSLAEVRRLCRVTMDTAIEPTLHVHQHDGSIMTLREYCTGLYFFDVADANNHRSSPNTTSSLVNGYSFVNTMSGNKERYHHREIEGADRA